MASPKLEATISVRTLQKQLQVITKLVPPASGNIAMQFTKGNLYLYAMNDLASCKSLVPCESCEGELSFGVTFDALKTILVGHETIKFSYSNTMLVCTSNNYRADLATVDAVEIEAFKNRELVKGEAKTLSIDAETGKWLKEACGEVRLKVVEALSPYMPCLVHLDSKGAFVSCYDNHHLSFIKTSKVKGDLDFTMPCDTLYDVLSAFQGSSFKMELLPQQLTIKSKLMAIALSQPASDTYLEMSTLTGLINQAKEADKQAITVDRHLLQRFLGASKAVATKERLELKFKTQGKNLHLQVRTITGNVNQVLPMEKAVSIKEFSLDYSYFEEAIGKDDSEKVTIAVIEGRFIVVGFGNGYTIISLFG